MQTQTLVKFTGAVLISLLISACGGGGSSQLDTYKSSSRLSTSSSSSSVGGNNSQNSSVASSVDTTSPQKIGFGSGDDFNNGSIGVGVGGTTLAAGGSTMLTINVVSSTNTLVTNEIEVTFNSVCFASGEAKFTNLANAEASTVTTTNGQASINYIANGCVGNDLVTATASLAETVRVAQVTLNIESDTVQTIRFVDAVPSQISLKGTGGAETSLVRFQVLGSTGAPMKGVTLNFALSTSPGGLNLTSTSTTTDTGGYGSTTVQSGTIHTAVRVTATDPDTNLSTQSSQLIVSTGIPDQDSMSLSATDTHPVGWDIDGVQSTINIRLSDSFNNPPPAGTAVSFATEGGTIGSGCTTNAAGSCTVIWSSGNPKPERNSSVNTDLRKLCVNADRSKVADYSQCIKERAGRITIYATAIGNESFVDGGGDGFFDLEEDEFGKVSNGGDCQLNSPPSTYSTPEQSSTIPCDDLPEAYMDKNENGVRDSNEEFIDFFPSINGAPAYTPANDKYNGVLCRVADADNDLCSREQVTIRQDMVLVMTSRDVLRTEAEGKLPFIDKLLPTSVDSNSITEFLLADKNGHGVGEGTTLRVLTNNLNDAQAGLSIVGPLAASDEPQWVQLIIDPTSDTEAPSGSVTIEITTPTILGNRITTETVAMVPTP